MKTLKIQNVYLVEVAVSPWPTVLVQIGTLAHLCRRRGADTIDPRFKPYM